jgi:hypothetical protein
MQTSDIISTTFALPTIGIIITYGYSIIRNRIRKDTHASNEDASHKEMINAYKAERDLVKQDFDRLIERINIAEKERNEAVSKVGKLSAENEFRAAQNIEYKTLIEKLTLSLDLARTDTQKYAVDHSKQQAKISYLTAILNDRIEKM